MIRFLKLAQFALSLGVTVLCLVIYPGVMALFAALVGLIYVRSSIGAFQEKRIFIWIGFAFSSAVAVISVLGVTRFARNGFAFATGNFPHEAGVYLLPYLFLAIAILSTLVIVAHLVSWRWMLGRQLEHTA